MKLTYDNMVTHMNNYFKGFSTYAQDPKTQYRMNEFLAPEVEIIAYEKTIKKMSRERFYRDCIHPNLKETLTHGQLVVDERQGTVAALMKTKIKHKVTGEIKFSVWLNIIYQLKIDEDKTIKIAKVLIFMQNKPEVLTWRNIISSK